MLKRMTSSCWQEKGHEDYQMAHEKLFIIQTESLLKPYGVSIMIKTSLSQLSEVLSARLVGQDCNIEAVTTDTRQVPEKALFVALVGERLMRTDFASSKLWTMVLVRFW